MAFIGRMNELSVVRKKDHGVYLDGGDLGDILLPRKYVPKDCEIDDKIEVFIYRDSEDRLVTTTDRPYAMIGEFAFLTIVSVNKVGAFADWGLPKDLLIPFSEQQMRMEEGKAYIVRLYMDRHSNRIVATSKIDSFLDLKDHDYKEGEEIEILTSYKTDLGRKVIIHDAHWGFIHEDDIFGDLQRGQKIKAFIKKLRPDGKIDVCLQKPGYEKVTDFSRVILDTIERHGGMLRVTDKSSPAEISKLFGVSKKTFKKAIGALYKKRLITIEENLIKLKTHTE